MRPWRPWNGLYREALDNPGVVGLAIGTRPDCVDEEKIALLESLARDRFILVEYGLQSVHDRTLEWINRGHDYACFRSALALTAGRGIHVGAHIILGPLRRPGTICLPWPASFRACPWSSSRSTSSRW